MYWHDISDPTNDIEASKKWLTAITGSKPYFDQPYYVGYSVGGYELGLDPNGSIEDGPITYWGVTNCEQAFAELIDAGGRERTPVSDVGDSIKVASIYDPIGNIVGVIENPHVAVHKDDGASTG